MSLILRIDFWDGKGTTAATGLAAAGLVNALVYTTLGMAVPTVLGCFAGQSCFYRGVHSDKNILLSFLLAPVGESSHL
jgi:hypothetical protein